MLALSVPAQGLSFSTCIWGCDPPLLVFPLLQGFWLKQLAAWMMAVELGVWRPALLDEGEIV